MNEQSLPTPIVEDFADIRDRMLAIRDGFEPVIEIIGIDFGRGPSDIVAMIADVERKIFEMCAIPSWMLK